MALLVGRAASSIKVPVLIRDYLSGRQAFPEDADGDAATRASEGDYLSRMHHRVKNLIRTRKPTYQWPRGHSFRATIRNLRAIGLVEVTGRREPGKLDPARGFEERTWVRITPGAIDRPEWYNLRSALAAHYPGLARMAPPAPKPPAPPRRPARRALVRVIVPELPLEPPLKDKVALWPGLLDEREKARGVQALAEQIAALEDLDRQRLGGLEDVEQAILEYAEIKRAGLTSEEYQEEKQEAWDAIAEAVDSLEVLPGEEVEEEVAQPKPTRTRGPRQPPGELIAQGEDLLQMLSQAAARGTDPKLFEDVHNSALAWFKEARPFLNATADQVTDVKNGIDLMGSCAERLRKASSVGPARAQQASACRAAAAVLRSAIAKGLRPTVPGLKRETQGRATPTPSQPGAAIPKKGAERQVDLDHLETERLAIRNLAVTTLRAATPEDFERLGAASAAFLERAGTILTAREVGPSRKDISDAIDDLGRCIRAMRTDPTDNKAAAACRNAVVILAAVFARPLQRHA